MSTLPPMETTSYRIGITCATYWPTGMMRGTVVRYFSIEEDSTILGGMRAINVAHEQANHALDDHSVTIEPNPAEQGWPVGN